MPTRDAVIPQDDFASGMVRDVARHLIPLDGAYDINNGVLNEDGSIYRRGGTAYKSNAPFGESLTFLWDGFMQPGRRTVTANSEDFGVLSSDDATIQNIDSDGLPYPKSAAYLAGLLFISGGYIYGGSRMDTGPYAAGTVALTTATFDQFGNCTNATAAKTVTGTGTSFLGNVDAGMLFQRGNERVYVVESVDSNTQLTLTEPYEGATGSGITYILRRVKQITAADPYPISELYATVQRRLVWATDNLIEFSEVDKPHDQTNRFGTVNSHTLPEGVSVIGIAAISSAAVIFTTAGIWTLQGLAFDIVDAVGTPQHRLSVLSRDLILFGQPGIATWEQLLVAPCTNGVYLIDGVSSPVLISRSIDPLYTYYTTRAYRAGGATVHRNHYLLPVLNSGGSPHDFLVCRLSRSALDRRRRPAFPWTRFSGQGANLTAVVVRSGDLSGTPSPKLLGAEGPTSARVVDCAFFDPDAAHATDSDGSVHIQDTVTRDIDTGNTTLNVIRDAKARFELADSGSAGPTVKASWGDGATAGLPNWGEVDWGEFEWSGAGAIFYNLSPDGAVNNGLNPHRWRINKRRRYVRLRFRTNGPCASYTLRGYEATVRPSQAVRR